MLVSGKRLAGRVGNIADIGITKKYLTEEDLAIERGFKNIINSFGDNHVLYAEEENDVFKNSDNLWWLTQSAAQKVSLKAGRILIQ